ncbi:DUF5133 domain-containing protein [Streptomyces sp. SL13]|uniref:DUF5133 domain-containing protein n=1 Tax=Streptantibioticus silvisoli TaxID=2705255 RepID=A0AA90K717_9ACTN|nr:DUF5133 domain-containing protein [Streptantibioticus silvisoli]MDI5967812.1 DUF5133 domain-containing protein [Streptantibioticus silvisoli]
MLQPRPTILRGLVQRFEDRRAAYSATGTAETRQQMNDAAYTLCVTTGTRDIDTALMIARRLISLTPAPTPTAEPEPDPTPA